MTTQRPVAGLLLDFGGVISKTTFENLERVERGLGLDAGTLSWRGPLDPDTDPLWRDMLADGSRSGAIGKRARPRSVRLSGSSGISAS
jgi:hypothetical protein